MQTSLLGISFRNPVLAASGTFGYGIEFEQQVDLNSLGGIIVKGLSREPIAGNAAPRLWEARAGMINSVGLQNIGARAFITEKLPLLRKFSTPIIANVFGYSAEDYLEVVRILNDAEGLAAYELNVSCPNTKHGGLAFGVDEDALCDLVSRVKAASTRPVIVKLSPNVAAIEPFALVAERSGADAISLVNTFIALAVDAKTRKRADWRRLRRTVRACHQAHRAADGASGRARLENTGDRYGRYCHRRGCRGIHAGRREPGRSGDGDLLGSDGARSHCARTRSDAAGTGCCTSFRTNRKIEFMRSSIAAACMLAALTMASCSKAPKPLPHETAPANFKVNFDTTRGPVIVEITRTLAPLGADRFYNMVQAKYFDEVRFFRVVPGFMVQFGLAADPDTIEKWDQNIQDDPVLTSNRRGTISFAQTSQPNTRATQFFINLGNNERLDAQHFSPFGKVVEGMDNVDAIYSGDGEKPDQTAIKTRGNAYLEKEFPRLDYIKTARVVQ